MIGKLTRFFFRAWRPTLLIIVLAGVAYLVFFRQLGTLLPGYSSREVASMQMSTHARDILAQPLNAPYKLLVYFGQHIGHHGLLVTRVSAALFGVLASAIFYYVARRWFSYRIALFCTILFATSSGLMHVSRLGSPLVLQLAPLLLLGIGLWASKARHLLLAFYVSIIVLSVVLYIPGMIWFELAGLLLLHSQVRNELNSIPTKHRLLGLLLGLVALVPLIRAVVLHPHQLLTMAGLPQHFYSISVIASNFGHTLLAIGLQSSGTPDLWLGHAPLLDFIQLVLAGIGVYAYIHNFRLSRSPFLLFGTLLGIILVSLGGDVSIGILLPFLYLLVAGGLRKLLGDWLAVFPRNPIARFMGIFVVCILVFFSVLYQWRAYFVAWPHNDRTQTTFRIQS